MARGRLMQLIPYDLRRPTTAAFIGGRNTENTSSLVDYESGGVGIGNTSQGHLYQTWKAEVVNNMRVVLSSANTEPATVIEVLDGAITEVSFTFDQNMRPTVAYMHDGVAKLYWFDTAAGEQVTSTFSGIRDPRVTLNDKRALFVPFSTMILAYLRGEQLCCRLQTDRFTVEYILAQDAGGAAKLNRIGAAVNSRMRYELTGLGSGECPW